MTYTLNPFHPPWIWDQRGDKRGGSPLRHAGRRRGAPRRQSSVPPRDATWILRARCLLAVRPRYRVAAHLRARPNRFPRRPIRPLRRRPRRLLRLSLPSHPDHLPAMALMTSACWSWLWSHAALSYRPLRMHCRTPWLGGLGRRSRRPWSVIICTRPLGLLRARRPYTATSRRTSSCASDDWRTSIWFSARRMLRACLSP